MLNHHHISVVIPAKDEDGAIGQVVSGLLQQRNRDNEPLVDDIIVCDNGSTDNTLHIARLYGARVIKQPVAGYGIACLTAMSVLSDKTDIVLFVDGDRSCNPLQAHDLCKAIINGADLAIGSRKLGYIEADAMSTAQRFGNALACWILTALYRKQVSDLGPYRAIRKTKLDALEMQDRSFGWTVEMQAKALERNYHIKEVAVDCRRRIGVSKISGTFSGVVGAGKGILSTIFKVWWQHRRNQDVNAVILSKASGEA
ncbi:MAG: glycosyltransferase family 2 protein [Gammaproteobacteria bacterium]|nr:glycosyltransferase family 2 protein [Gammaproteobacteria bacterium]